MVEMGSQWCHWVAHGIPNVPKWNQKSIPKPDYHDSRVLAWSNNTNGEPKAPQRPPKQSQHETHPENTWAPDGSRRLQMAPEGSRRLQKAPEGSRQLQKAPGGSRWLQKAPGGSRWLQKAPEGSRRLQVAPDGSRWLQVAPDGSRWFKMAPGGSRWINPINEHVTVHCACAELLKVLL